MKDTRPFDLSAAKAGAPIICRNGNPATILKWNAKNSLYPLIGTAIHEGEEYAESWSSTGARDVDETHEYDLFMAPLGYIDGKPVFVGDDLESEGPEGWVHCKAHPETRDFTRCRWPAPAKQYPLSKMTRAEVCEAAGVAEESIYVLYFFKVANAALRHAIDAGQVMLPGAAMSDADILEAVCEAERTHCLVLSDKGRTVFVSAVKSLLVSEPEIDQLRANRAARDMAIAEAVHEEAKRAAMYPGAAMQVAGLNLTSIIEKVKP